ncbi:5-hydroxytryptamine receptor 1A [Exaiptasia diaphana]|uniref:G-protein coupled receptors family 1 profile domain-containing protein n=1 Tax=Exaiptasia diaphana TaxID=2652724 RepID=A0A913YNB9_EXADI|nr:5-hydroxytryptamine receptor 1A [Exaiptasia diaphana]XP_028516635.1 5-hydroxytryptamine receptor 1A [Exaiptasia diaphana]
MVDHSSNPTFPPLPPDPGGDPGQDILENVLKQLEDCGVNGTNLTSISSMNDSQRILYIGSLLDKYNCSGAGNGPPTSIPQVGNSKIPPHVLLVIYFVTVMVLGLLVNLCVIGTITRVRRLRTITNCFVLSLAFADLLMAAVVVPLQIKELYRPQTQSSPFIDTLFPILGVASLLNLCAVTLDRYFTITNPLTYEAKVSSVRAGFIIASIWIIATAQGLIDLLAIPFEDQPVFQVVRFVIVFSIPFICVIFVNTKIYCIARGHARQIRANEPGQTTSGGRSFSRKIKTAQVIGLLVGTFVLTWLPYFILTIYEQFEEGKGNTPRALKIVKKVTEALACSTALFNPLLYGFLRKEVRIAIIRGLKCQNVNLSDLDTTATAENTTRRLEITRK